MDPASIVRIGVVPFNPSSPASAILVPVADSGGKNVPSQLSPVYQIYWFQLIRSELLDVPVTSNTVSIHCNCGLSDRLRLERSAGVFLKS